MANWLNFDRLKQWECAVFPAFQYDYITLKDIRLALEDVESVAKIPIHQDWEDDNWLANHPTIPEPQKHTYRVAALIRAFASGNRMQEPIYLDTFLVGRCGCGIGNGHHRIRALQYLGVPAGPFGLSGHLDLLEGLISTAGSEIPTEYAHYFADTLLIPQEDDVLL